MTSPRPMPPCEGGHQPGYVEAVGTAQYSPNQPILQQYAETAFNGLRRQHFRFVKDAGQWFRWSTNDNCWVYVDSAEVYEIVAERLGNIPRWLLRYLTAEAQRDRRISGGGSLANAPIISFTARA